MCRKSNISVTKQGLGLQVKYLRATETQYDKFIPDGLGQRIDFTKRLADCSELISFSVCVKR